MLFLHNFYQLCEEEVIKKPRKLPSYILFLAVLLLMGGCYTDTEPAVDPPGKKESTTTDVLEKGAAALQSDAPLDPMNIYLVGFHPMKENPSYQMEAHHYCQQMNEDFAQCVLFDGNTSDANLTGIEYIISEKLFESLDDEEQAYWHPHNYEILSGQLAAPGLPDIASEKLMESKINSYGKTWHIWCTGNAGETGNKMPLGDPKLAWSFNRDGEAKPGLVEQRDKRMGINTKKIRKERKKFMHLAHPQEGVNTLKGAFRGQTKATPRVAAKEDPRVSVDSSKSSGRNN